MTTLPGDYPADSASAFEQLKRRPRLALDDLKVLAMLESAGEAFYLAIARASGNEQARRLLTRSGQEERGHAHRLVKAIRLLSGETYEIPADEHNPFVQSLPAQMPAHADFLAMLAQGERDGDLQYQKWADAEPNAEVAKLYRQNGVEETTHAERLAEVRGLLSPGGTQRPAANP